MLSLSDYGLEYPDASACCAFLEASSSELFGQERLKGGARTNISASQDGRISKAYTEGYWYGGGGLDTDGLVDLGLYPSLIIE